MNMLYSGNNLIGGTSAAARNVIAVQGTPLGITASMARITRCRGTLSVLILQGQQRWAASTRVMSQFNPTATSLAAQTLELGM